MENIDIGGPAMIRAAAKNHEHVTVVVDPSDYSQLLEALAGSSGDAEALAFRKRCAWKAFQHCATYDSTVAEWLWCAEGWGRGIGGGLRGVGGPGAGAASSNAAAFSGCFFWLLFLGRTMPLWAFAPAIFLNCVPPASYFAAARWRSGCGAPWARALPPR